MTVEYFLEYCIDAGMLTVALYDVDEVVLIWQGFGDEVPDNYLYLDVESFDVPSVSGEMTLNVSTGE